jgi:hypothetical protein
VGVPELNAPVSCAAASCKHARLVRIPSYGFDCCLVMAESSHRTILTQVPQH